MRGAVQGITRLLSSCTIVAQKWVLAMVSLCVTPRYRGGECYKTLYFRRDFLPNEGFWTPEMKLGSCPLAG